ncbi:MAG: peptidylprolyl isomerase [Brucellaceae bacterium]|jgi:cyclophilin family peptidyl-prolyl cis-trans isomerase|nr:peptidylprolyl isomerase [Brucellaceae bacterium]
MSFLRKLLAVTAFLAFSATAALQPVSAQAADPENTVVLTLKDGDVVIELRPDLAPKHAAQIKKLVRDGAYNGVVFHRVIDGFMAQTGDVQFGNADKGYNPGRAGTGGSSYGNIPAEFSKQPFVRGTVGMARSQSPDSANSQFFIMFDEGSFLNGQYTVVGEVVSGMENVDKIKKGSKSANGAVDNPDRIVKAIVLADRK